MKSNLVLLVFLTIETKDVLQKCLELSEKWIPDGQFPDRKSANYLPSPIREGTASEVNAGGRGGQKGWFRRDGLRCLLCFRAWRRGVADGRVRMWRPRISCNRGVVEPTCRNFVFLSKLSSPCVCKIKCTKTDEKMAVGFYRRHGPDLPTPRKSLAMPLVVVEMVGMEP